MGALYPDHVLASHLNLVSGQPPNWRSNPLLALQHAFTPYTLRERHGLARTQLFLERGNGYLPKIWGRAIGQVIHESDHDSGGRAFRRVGEAGSDCKGFKKHVQKRGTCLRACTRAGWILRKAR